MNRRRFLRALAAVPVAAAMPMPTLEALAPAAAASVTPMEFGIAFASIEDYDFDRLTQTAKWLGASMRQQQEDLAARVFYDPTKGAIE